MNEVIFYGSSDDLIEVDGTIPGCDEFNESEGSFEVAGLRIDVEYQSNGCWSVRACQVDESVPVTAESVALDLPSSGGLSEEALRGEAPPYPSYSVRLRLIVPDGSHVTKIN